MDDRIWLSFADGGKLEEGLQAALLGGKGAALARMASMGLPVPPGFTLTTQACRRFLTNGWNETFDIALSQGLGQLECVVGRKVGDPERPLLVSIRSGAPVSMPGMMDTVLNVGMTPAVADGLGRAADNQRFGWDTYRRFIQSYASVVLEAPAALLSELAERHFGQDDGVSLEPPALFDAGRRLATDLMTEGFTVPDDPQVQIRHAVAAVFRSWEGERAATYRRIEGIDAELGTAATVQMMTFGNLGTRSGTGVAFSRDPSTGKPATVGDFLAEAQGEDVVAGTHRTLPIAVMGERWPEVAAELQRTIIVLERDLADLVDIEFTVEDGRLWLLQVRRGKRSPRAALRMAIDMADDTDFPLSREQALERVADILEDPPTETAGSAATSNDSELTCGLAASPGRAVGRIHTVVESALTAEAKGEAVVLVRNETSPADIAGMAVAKAIVTALGGLVSHAAVVARGWGVPAVVGADAIQVGADGIQIGERFLPTGTEVTVDGDTGQVFLGAHHANEVEIPEVGVLRSWLVPSSTSSDSGERDGGESDTDPAERPTSDGEPVTTETVGRALALKGMGDAETIARVLGAKPSELSPVLDALVQAGDAQSMPNGRVLPSTALRERVDLAYREAAEVLKDRIEPHMGSFHLVNDDFKAVVTSWQVRSIDGEEVPNDHSDRAYDAQVVGRLRSEIHAGITPIIQQVAEAEPRLRRYLERLTDALRAVESGDVDMMAHPLKDSYHTVWFELHEELIRLSGRNRADEAAAGRG